MFTGGCCHLLKGFNGFFRLALLVNAQNGVDEHDDQDDKDICKALSRISGGHAGDGGGNQQDDDHRVTQLLEKPLEQRDLFPLVQLIRTVLGKPLTRLLLREA